MLLLFLCIYDQTTSVHVPKVFDSLDTSAILNQTSQKDIHSRRRGLIPNSRRRGDTFSQLFQKAQSKILWDRIVKKHKLRAQNQQNKADRSKSRQPTSGITNMTSQQVADLFSKNDSVFTQSVEEVSGVRRHKRWDYDENYDWENGRKDYVVPGEERKETKFEKFAKSWQKHALKAIFLFSVVCMLCCCCLAICKKFCGKVCETICWHLKDYREMCLNRDPSYRKARKFADDYGIELDYDQYTKIKRNYEEGFRRGGHDDYKNLSGRG